MRKVAGVLGILTGWLFVGIGWVLAGYVVLSAVPYLLPYVPVVATGLLLCELEDFRERTSQSR